MAVALSIASAQFSFARRSGCQRRWIHGLDPAEKSDAKNHADERYNRPCSNQRTTKTLFLRPSGCVFCFNVWARPPPSLSGNLLFTPTGNLRPNNGHAAQKPWDPDLAASSRSNHCSSLYRSAHPTVSILQGFFVAPLARVLGKYEPTEDDNMFMEAQTFNQSAASDRAISGCGELDLPEMFFAVQGPGGPSRGEWHRFVIHRREAASKCCSSSLLVPDVLAKRGTHFGFCLRNVDVRVELSTEQGCFLADISPARLSEVLLSELGHLFDLHA